MKKIVCFFLCALLFPAILSACHKKVYFLPDSEIDKLYPSHESEKTLPNPDAADLIGTYHIYGNDKSSFHTEWIAVVSRLEGKTVLQIFTIGSTHKKLTATELNNISVSYDSKTGHFIQKYKTEDYISAYDAYFYIENGRIRIDVHNKFIYPNEDEFANEGLLASGYKEEN